MVKKYRFRMKIHIMSSLVVVFIFLLNVLNNYTYEKSLFDFDIIFIICGSLASLGVLVNIFAYYSVEKDGLKLKSPIKCTKIKWSEILCIREQQPAGKLVGLSIAVFSNDKKISITPWTKDYKDLLREVVMNYQKEENALIYQDVRDLLK